MSSDDATPPAGSPVVAPYREPAPKIDVIAEALKTKAEAEETSLAQAHLRGQLDQAEADEIKSNTAMQTIAGIIDKVRALLDEARPAADLIPEPYRTYVLAVIRSVDVVDDALSKIGL